MSPLDIVIIVLLFLSVSLPNEYRLRDVVRYWTQIANFAYPKCICCSFSWQFFVGISL